MATLHLLVRLVHVAGMAVLLGGAALVWARVRSASDGVGVARLACAYEWLFWAAVGLVVLTGVGNLGALAPAVPGPHSPWGATFAVKLVAVLGLLVGSLVRTLAALLWRATDGTHEAQIGTAYAATGWYLVGLVALAEVLAHG